jgi:hypothetical protein
MKVPIGTQLRQFHDATVKGQDESRVDLSQ